MAGALKGAHCCAKGGPKLQIVSMYDYALRIGGYIHSRAIFCGWHESEVLAMFV